MKNISTALAAHLGGELTTLAELVKITRKDGSVIAFTSHDRDLIVDGVTYRADGAFTSAKLAQTSELKAQDFDVEGVLDSALINEADIKAGLYDHARIDFALCNWADVAQGVIALRRGWLGEIAISGGRYIAALRGLHDLMTRKVGETYTPECRYCLGEARCGVNLAGYTVNGQVSSVVDAYSFMDMTRSEASGYFNDGVLTWLTGANAGAKCEVNNWDLTGQTMTLWMPCAYPIAAGDGYSVTAGCDKRFSTCRTRFGNSAHYGGFPYLPGLGKILQYPDG